MKDTKGEKVVKIRRGFVSNSSSSSFIIGAVKILDLEEALDLEKNSQDNYNIDLKIVKDSDLVESEETRKENIDYRYTLGVDRKGNLEYRDIDIFAPTNEEEECSCDIKECQEDSKYLLVSIGHDEGDGPFCHFEDGFYGLDYSIVNEEYFKTNYPDSYKVLMYLKGITGVSERLSYKFGVSRNG